MSETKTIAEFLHDKHGGEGVLTLDAMSQDVRSHGWRVLLNDERGCERWVFPDGSSIIISEGGWDLGFRTECTCFAGNNCHDDNRCEVYGEDTR